MERIMNEENGWDHNVEGDAVEGPVVCVSREEVLQALDEMKTCKAHGPSEVSLELIAARWGVGHMVRMLVCGCKAHGPSEVSLELIAARWGVGHVVRMLVCGCKAHGPSEVSLELIAARWGVGHVVRMLVCGCMAHGPSEVSLESIAARWGVGIQVMAEISVMWLECWFWIQRLTVRTPASVCCVLEQDTLSALLQSTQVGSTLRLVFSAMSFSEE